MRLLQALLSGVFAAVALLAGLVVAGLVALAGLAMLLGRRRPLRPVGAPRPASARAGVRPRDEGDVIDVTVTEVPSDSLKR